MSQENISEEQVRIQKIQQLKDFGIVPYAQQFDKQVMIGSLVQKHGQILDGTSPFRDSEVIIDGPTKDIKTAGRITLLRTHGKLSFAKLMDESGEIQLMFHKGSYTIAKIINGQVVSQLSELTSVDQKKTMSAHKFVEKMIDVGDRIGVEGEMFYTHKGELTIFVSVLYFLAKATKPLGDKFHGIGDGQEHAYRKRYLDMIFNPASMQRMKLRSTFIKTLRDFYHQAGFIELDTPILGVSASGAAAKPFVTHHEDFDLDMYLRIAPEIALKMATVGGLEKVFEIGKDFRNEGSSPSHHQEFLVVEHYAVYRNYEDNMLFTEQMFDYLFAHVDDLSPVVKIPDKSGNVRDVDFTTPWQRIDYTQQIKKDSGIDISQYGPNDDDQLRADIRAEGHEWVGLETQSVPTMIDYLYKKVTRPSIVGPAFVYNYPKTMQPLARTSDSDATIVEQFQVVVNGWEIVKAYSELVDPIEQQANFDAQATALAQGDEEATPGDPVFVESMKYGMPPQSGWGMGIDRILALLTEQANIRDVIMFPMMKPLDSHLTNNNGKNIQEQNDSDKSKFNVTEEHSGSQDLGDRFSDGPCPSIHDVETLAKKYLSDTHRHCQEVGDVMRWFAKKLGKSQEEQERWYVTGLLHDIDRDHIDKDMHSHLGEQFLDIMEEISAPQSLILDIRSHYIEKGYAPMDSELRKYLVSVDELSGFLYAYSLMRPEGYEGMKWKSINKKLKDKKFAAGVNRQHVRYCEEYLDIPLNKFALEVAQALYETQQK